MSHGVPSGPPGENSPPVQGKGGASIWSDLGAALGQDAGAAPSTTPWDGLVVPGPGGQGGSEPPQGTPAAAASAGGTPGGGFFTLLYVSAAVIGIVPTFISHQWWPVPLAALVVYTIVGYRRAELTGTIYEFADSVYYLGFTLSIGSLLASLEPFNTVDRPDPEKIFHYFGLGMFTTLVGVAARTALQTYHRLPAETLEEVTRRVTAEAHRYVERLAELNGQVLRILDHTTGTLEARIAPQLGRVEEHIGRSVTALEGMSEIAAGLTTSVKEAGAVLEASQTSHRAAIEQVGAAQRRLAGAVETLASTVSDASGSIGTQVHRLAGELDATGTALGRVEERLLNLQLDAAPLTGSLDLAARAITDAAGAVQAEVTALGATIRRFAEEVHQAQTAGRVLASSQLGDAVAHLSRELEALAQVAQSQRELAAAEIERLHAGAESIVTGAQALSRALDEVVDVALRRLDGLAAAAPVEGPGRVEGGGVS
jgi:uncharacterized protein YukE